MAGINFNAQDVAPQQAFENLAPGWYTAMIVESELKPTQAGTGSYLEITIEVVAPQQFAGRKLWDRLNLNNPNEKAVEIAYQTLSAICHATGVIQVQDSQQLHNIPMDVKVGMSKVTEQYPEPRNEVKGYRACQGAAAPQGMQQPAQQQPVQQQATQQQPAQQQGAWQQQNTQQQQPAQQMQQQPAQQQPAQQQGGWQNAQVDPNAQAQQQPAQQQAMQQEAAPEMQMQQPATNQQAQQAAQGGKAPWQQ